MEPVFCIILTFFFTGAANFANCIVADSGVLFPLGKWCRRGGDLQAKLMKLITNKNTTDDEKLKD